ncbi:hypothetical protein EXIGLDRAFT_772070 [Exidia glandulosa HHB12029]|uniref:Mid2 domain-containing protein n=1 Tax=Exidia glandulosa HHB12029 TaxID=1314781 RepID=A0A165FK56_EXIGL|nr:hypothetical protein EXIGLDRAFT_772070 [Exidia glandulosa HHB12029]
MEHRPRAYLTSRALFILSIATVHSVRAATTCAAKVEAALKTVKGDGVGVSCCKADEADCQLSVIGACDDVYSTWGWCMGAGTSKACAISYGPDSDAPCGAYSGPTGSTYGLSPVGDGTGYKVSLQSPSIEASLHTNWDRLATLSDVGLCCSSADVAGAAACHVGKVLTLAENPCNAGEYEIKCFGTGTHGLCTAYSNVSATTEIGQYYFVNFDENAPRPSSTSTGSNVSFTPTASYASSTPTASPSGTPGSSTSTPLTPTSSSDKSSVNVAAIVVPIILVLMLLGLGIWFIFWRRRRAAHAPLTGNSGNAVHPYTAATGGTGSSPTSAWAESVPMTQIGGSSNSSGPTDKYARIQQEQRRPVSPPLPPYSLHSDP